MKQNKHYIILLFLLGLFAATNTSAQVINAGVGGNSTINLLKRLEVDVLQKTPDLVILMVGTNDMLNSKKMISYSIYESNLKEIVQKIKANGSKIVMMAPPPADSTYLYERHDRKSYQEVPNEKLDSIRRIITKVADENNLGYIDLFQAFSDRNLPQHNQDLFIKNERNSGVRDGVHPTSLGYRFIAEIVFDYLKSNTLLKEDQKVICFGDSITRGGGTKKSNSILNRNYPAILSELIDEYAQRRKK